MSTTNDRLNLKDSIFVQPSKETVTANRKNPVLLGDNDNVEVPVADNTVLMYDKNGSTISDIDRAAAQSVGRETSINYYVRVGLDGNLYDPNGIYSTPSDLLLAEKGTGRAKYEFAPVVGDVFVDYVQYLKNHNKAYLRRAEGVFRNG